MDKNGFLFQKLKNWMYNQTMEVTVLIHMMPPPAQLEQPHTEGPVYVKHAHKPRSCSVFSTSDVTRVVSPLWFARCGWWRSRSPGATGIQLFSFQEQQHKYPLDTSHFDQPPPQRNNTTSARGFRNKTQRKRSVRRNATVTMFSYWFANVACLFFRSPRCSVTPQKTEFKVNQSYNEGSITQLPVLTVPSSVSLT